MSKYVFELGDVQYDRDGKKITDLTPLLNLSERADVPFSTLQTWLEKPERMAAYMPFLVADRIVCGIGGGVMWWRSEMPEHYYGVSLDWGVCECPGCTKMFRLGRVSRGPTVKRYCSKNCADAHSRIRLGQQETRVKNYGSRLAPRKGDKCRHGHPRTPENIKVRKNGKTECAACHRESARRSYAARKKALATAA